MIPRGIHIYSSLKPRKFLKNFIIACKPKFFKLSESQWRTTKFRVLAVLWWNSMWIKFHCLHVRSSPTAAILNLNVSGHRFSKRHSIHEVPTCHMLKMACLSLTAFSKKRYLPEMTEQAPKRKFCQKLWTREFTRLHFDKVTQRKFGSLCENRRKILFNCKWWKTPHFQNWLEDLRRSQTDSNS